jgi:hypothetical protein
MTEDEGIVASCLSAKLGGGWRIKDEGDKDCNMSLVLGMMIE